MLKTAAAARYGKAFFRVAQSSGRIEDLGGELGTATEVLVGDAAARQFWANPLVALKRKMDVLEYAFGKLDPAPGDECRRFLAVVLTNGRMEFLPDILQTYKNLCNEAAGRVSIEVKTAMPLSDEERDRLKSVLGKKAGGEALLTVEQDPGLLAGIVARIGDTVYDFSARGKLQRLAARLSA